MKLEAFLNPGSKEAAAKGCLCPRMDNEYGRGYMGGVKDENGHTVFVYRLDCPVHQERVELYEASS